MQVLRQDSTGETEIRGTAADLAELAELMLSGDGAILLDRPENPWPYDRSLVSVQIVHASGPVVVQICADSDMLHLRGGTTHFSLLAVNVQGFADDDDVTGHMHIDFPAHAYLDESSEPLVFALPN
jgi:hypothetical protein